MRKLNKGRWVFFYVFVFVVGLLFLNGTPAFAASSTDLETIGHFDLPSANQTISGEINIHGWVLDDSGVSKIELYIDGNYINNVNYGDARTDVGSAYPSYENNNSGFHYSFDTKKLLDGTHTIYIKEYGKDNSVTKISGPSFKVNNNLPVLGHVDGPSSNQMVNGTINVHGWLLDSSGVSKIDLYSDGQRVDSVSYGDSRPDVMQVYPDYYNKNSGFHYSLDTKKLKDGQHNLSIVEYGQNQKSKTINGPTITVKNNLPINGYLDGLSPNQSINGVVNVHGWFIDGSDIKTINILVDGKSAGQATYGDTRTDIASAYPDYNNKNAGFHFNLDTKNYAYGKHTLSVVATANNGDQKTLSVSNLSILPAVGYIDGPSSKDVLGNDVNVHGWFLDGVGVSEIHVLVDNQDMGKVTYGDSRTDVAAAYPNYQEKNSGWHFDLDTMKFKNGNHSLSIVETSRSGSKKTIQGPTITIKNNLKQYITTSYSESLTDELDTQMSVSPLTDQTIGYIRDDAFSNTYSSDGETYGVVSGGWNVRSTPSTDLSPIGSVSDGQQVQILQKTSTKDSSGHYWYEIQFYSGSMQPASSQEVLYYLDPSNFSPSSDSYFQFLKLSSTMYLQLDDANRVLSGKGILDGMGQYFLKAGTEYNINELYLIAHAFLETGNGTSKLATGYYTINGKHVYNMYGIGAVDSNPEQAGAQFAYDEGWFTPQDAIIGGAKWISDFYVNNASRDQDTLYKMKWNPANPGTHQYATDIGWAVKQTDEIASLYSLVNNYVLTFDVPNFK